MKKYDEGYALPFVLVIFLIVSLVATSLLTVSLNNLQRQKASIQRMEDRYTAQGAVEAVAAQLRDEDLLRGFQGATPAAAIAAKVDSICDTINNNVENGGAVSRDTAAETVYTPEQDDKFTCTFDLVSASGSVEVSCRIILKGTIDSSAFDATVLHTISGPVIIYDSYAITTIESAPEENGGGGE